MTRCIQIYLCELVVETIVDENYSIVYDLGFKSVLKTLFWRSLML